MLTTPSPFVLPPRQRGPLAITHVNVLPMDEDRLLTDQTVILEDGYIRTLEPAQNRDVTAMQQVDGSGKYLSPGLADMHVHYWNRGENPGEFAMFLANGVTLVRNMWGRPDHLALARQIQQGQLPGPRIVTTSPIIDGANAKGQVVHPGSILLEDPEAAYRLVAHYAARGYQQIKVYSQLTLPVLRALGKATATSGLRMTGHCPYHITFEEAIAAGVSCFEHLTAIENGHLQNNVAALNFWPNTLEAYRQRIALIDYDAIHRLAQYMAKEQIWNCPTLTIYQPRAIEPALLMQNSWLQYQFPGQREQWRNAIQRTENAEDWLKIGQGLYEMYLHIVSILHQEGAPLLLGTDTPNPFVYQGFSLHQELEHLVQAGFSPYEALRCGTCEAARFLGESALWGTVSVGKRADLLLTRTNPLDDIVAVRDLEAVFINGFIYRRENLDALLSQRAELVASLEEDSAPTPVLQPAELDNDQVIRQGILVDRVQNRESGRIAYRHSRRADATLLVEERYVNIRRTRQDTVRLVVGYDGVLQEGEVEQESSVGVVKHTITRLIEGGYRIHSKDVDDFETLTLLDQPALIPDERLSITTMPLALAALHNGNTALLALSLGREEPQVIRIEVSSTTQEVSPTALLQQWQVTVALPGQPSIQRYQATLDKALVSMQLEWRGRPWREIRGAVD